ncbi:zf-HC2 domain-containing protein [Telluria mixta]|uniref:Zf-HC2 domain-containing protein n=1 Tax=Telluria mixta TaxID=34071 RepID=A0ABT2BX53_9BURK|nr:zf-HC2 domain-containing protein [Telluria mixta]MCS0629728.1 zf-HC2 domain-containing protein [Telluria mixta]WEM96704.1 zf-HC2 domain-containing protein [Telluria mixta]
MNLHTDHLDAQDALPWLANGTLAGAELERVQAHVATCAHCRADLALLRTVHAAGPGPDLDFDADRALARLMPQLDEAPVQEQPGLLQRWRDRVAANDRTWLRAAVALQFGAIAVLAALLARPGAQPDSYRALGAAGANGMARVVVTFRPDTPEAELRRIVRASGARIVGGPTVTDAWLVGADGGLDPVLARLRAEPAVTLAEPLTVDKQP